MNVNKCRILITEPTKIKQSKLKECSTSLTDGNLVDSSPLVSSEKVELRFMLTQSNTGAVVFREEMTARTFQRLFEKGRLLGKRSVSYAKTVNSFRKSALSMNLKCFCDTCIMSFKAK